MNDEPFTLNGLTVSDYFEKIWDEYNKEKENIKSEVKVRKTIFVVRTLFLLLIL